MKIGRNQICPKCESGKKYKHCCGHHSKRNAPPQEFLKALDKHNARELIRQQQQGLGKPIIAAQSNGQQFVAVGNTLHYSRKWKTFSDFLSDFIKNTLGADWGNSELQKPLEKRHPILQWYNSLCELQQQNFDKSSKIQSMPLSGSAICYLGLAYNLYLLKHNIELQNIYIHRIKDINQFHGTYYELIVAGCLIRAGFKLELEDETDDSNKHCEFSAVSLKTGKKFWVEAKMRGVFGILGKTDGTKRKDPTSSLSKHIKNAFQKPAADNRLIFVDVNTKIGDEDIPDWINQAQRKLDAMEKDVGQRKSAYIFVTNMGFHWDLENERKGHAVMACAIGIPDFRSKGYFPLSEIYRKKQRHIDIYNIMDSFREYPAIPDTFNGDLPSNVFGENDPIPQIGETYFFDCIGDEGKYAKITSATVNEDEKRAYLGTNTGHILTKELSEDQIHDYKNHPDAFFGIIRKEGKGNDDDYEFFERLVEMHSEYSRENLLKHMKGWPKQEELKKLSKEDLVLTFSEGIMANIKNQLNEQYNYFS